MVLNLYSFSDAVISALQQRKFGAIVIYVSGRIYQGLSLLDALFLIFELDLQLLIELCCEVTDGKIIW